MKPRYTRNMAFSPTPYSSSPAKAPDKVMYEEEGSQPELPELPDYICWVEDKDAGILHISAGTKDDAILAAYPRSDGQLEYLVYEQKSGDWIWQTADEGDPSEGMIKTFMSEHHLWWSEHKPSSDDDNDDDEDEDKEDPPDTGELHVSHIIGEDSEEYLVEWDEPHVFPFWITKSAMPKALVQTWEMVKLKKHAYLRKHMRENNGSVKDFWPNQSFWNFGDEFEGIVPGGDSEEIVKVIQHRYPDCQRGLQDASVKEQTPSSLDEGKEEEEACELVDVRVRPDGSFEFWVLRVLLNDDGERKPYFTWQTQTEGNLSDAEIETCLIKHFTGNSLCSNPPFKPKKEVRTQVDRIIAEDSTHYLLSLHPHPEIEEITPFWLPREGTDGAVIDAWLLLCSQVGDSLLKYIKAFGSEEGFQSKFQFCAGDGFLAIIEKPVSEVTKKAVELRYPDAFVEMLEEKKEEESDEDCIVVKMRT